MSAGAYLLNLGRMPYLEAWDLQRSLAAAVSQGAMPETVILLEHPPVVTLGRRTGTERAPLRSATSTVTIVRRSDEGVWPLP